MPRGKLFILALLVAGGIALQLSGQFDLRELVSLAREHADKWWLYALLVTIQTVLFTFALPGSSLVWITAVIVPPLTATIVITAGTTLGSMAAYMFSARLSDEWRQTISGSRVYRLLKQEDSFFRLFALRIMPGFPHSVINYSSGLLRLKLVKFIPAAVAGTAVKNYLYSVLIFNAASSGERLDRIDISALWALFALSLIILAFGIIWHNIAK